MNWLLIGANVILFFIGRAKPEFAAMMPLSSSRPEVLKFFTSMFAHANLAHLAGNMLFLYIFGNNVNDKMGHIGYLAFYLAGGVAAATTYIISEHAGHGILGASGAIAAVTGAYLVLLPRSHITMAYFFIFIGTIEIQSMLFILLFFAQDIFLNSANQDGVAHMAHIGGTVFGALVSLVLVVTHLLPRDQFDVWALIQRWNKRRQYRDLVSRGFNPFDPTKAGRDSKNEHPRAAEIQDLRDQISEAATGHQMDRAAELYVQLKLIDSSAVLARQTQLDVATQLHKEARYPQAAEAYESLLRVYPKLDRSEQVNLMVGIIYSRYLKQLDRAKEHLTRAVDRFHSGREQELARSELSAVELEIAQAKSK